MLAMAKQRAESGGLREIVNFKESDAENLDLANSSFNERYGSRLMHLLIFCICCRYNKQ